MRVAGFSAFSFLEQILQRGGKASIHLFVNDVDAYYVPFLHSVCD